MFNGAPVYGTDRCRVTYRYDAFLIYQVTKDLSNYLHFFFHQNYLCICTNLLSTTFILKQQLLTMSGTLPPRGSCFSLYRDEFISHHI